MDKKNQRKYIDDKYKIEDKTLEVMETHKGLNPRSTTIRIILIYLTIGILWVGFSDKFLGLIIQDLETYRTVEVYKGWIFVTFTGIIFFTIVYDRMKLFKIATDRIYNTYEELAAAYEELVAMEEELHEQVDLLEEIRTDLTSSNQRYQMVVDGANDGIWHWDFNSGKFFFSLPYKESFGYSLEEFESSVENFRGISHPDDVEDSVNRLNEYLESKEGIYNNICRLKTKGGEYRWIATRGKAIWDEEGNPVYAAGSHTDITEQKVLEDRLYELAYYDSLTMLPNKHLFFSSGEKLLKKAKEEGGRLALLYMDVDNFRNINETMGHEIGDKLIIHIGKIISKHVKEPNLISRLGGDEFGIIFTNIGREKTIGIIEKILEDIRRPWYYNNHIFFITVSMGIVTYPEHGEDLSALYQNADIALSHMEENGKDGYSLFTKEMVEKAWGYIEMDNSLKYALSHNEFQLYYQPQIDLRTNEIIGAEGLIRWFHPKKGFIPPMEFIPFAEKVGYIHQISRWVFKEACKQKQIWNEKGFLGLKVSINLSGEMFAFQELIKDTKNILDYHSIENSEVEFEITETAVMDDFENSIKVLKELRKLDISIALDDFGSGYSSLNYLKELPIDIIKIDRKFINDIGKSEKEASILKYIIELAHTLDLKVLAEGVETKEQLEFLKNHNCDYAQGYYFYKPMPAEDFIKVLGELK